jgi:hypothetical protein
MDRPTEHADSEGGIALGTPPENRWEDVVAGLRRFVGHFDGVLYAELGRACP